MRSASGSPHGVLATSTPRRFSGGLTPLIRAQVNAIKAAGWKTAPLVGERASAERFTEIERIKSDHPILEIVTTIREDGVRGNARIVALSDLGKQFYGYRSDTSLETFRGKPAGEFMLGLKPYIDPPATFWDDLLQDQSRVHARFAAGREALAMVPVRFNEWHPYFPNRIFVPLIAAAHQAADRRSTRGSLPGRSYLDIPLWDDAKQDVDMPALARDLARDSSHCSEGGDHPRPDRILAGRQR